MGRIFENEVLLRIQAKEVKSLILERGEIEKALELIAKNEEILSYNFGKGTYLTIIPTVHYHKGLPDKYKILDKIINKGVEIYEATENVDELVFYAAAACNLQKLDICMNIIAKDNYNKTKEGDTILLYFVKYANLENRNYLDTLRQLVHIYKLDVNKADYKGHSALVSYLNKYVSFQTKKITKYNDILLDAASIILGRNHVNQTSHKINDLSAENIIDAYDLEDQLKTRIIKNKFLSRIPSTSDNESVLFSLLAQKNEIEFIKVIEQKSNKIEDIFNVEDGNFTLLQLACDKNLENAVAYLVKKNVDVCRTTKRNRKTPLEIAARRNFFNIFKELLKTNKILIDSNLFATFLVNRGRQIKTKYFDEILTYEGLPVNITYENGNTPLHYAIIFSNSEAVLTLLNRGASLLAKNNVNKDPLDYISKEDLEMYLDRCILFDNHNKMHSKKYELRFDFNSFRQKKHSEVEVVSRICSSSRLQSLAEHPLITAFVELKWNLVQNYYEKIINCYIFFFVYSFLLFLVGNLTFFYLLLMSFLIVCTFRPRFHLKYFKQFDLVSSVLYTAFAFCIYFIFNDAIAVAILIMLSCFYQFLQQSIHFAKYQAKVIRGFRKVTPYIIATVTLHYLNDFKNHVLIVSLFCYIFLITYSYNTLTDSICNIDSCLKTVHNKQILDFMKFCEDIYRSFNVNSDNPFFWEHTENDNGNKKVYVNFFLNKNKFGNENFHFFRFDVATVEKLQNFVIRNKQNRKNV